MSERIAAYVDGFNLCNGLRAVRGRRDLWLDLESLLRAFLDPSRQELVAVNYFTAPVLGPGAERQQTYLDALVAHGGCTTVWLWRFQRKQQRCRACGATWVIHEEKESDVALSVLALEDAVSGVADQVWYVSGDSDLCPSVRAVGRAAPGVRRVAVFPPRRSSVDLERAADGTVRIFDRVPSRHQLPDTVVGADRATFTRPAYWGRG